MKTGHKHYDLDSCAPKQWKRSVQTKEMKDSGLSSLMLSPLCDDLPGRHIQDDPRICKIRRKESRQLNTASL